MKIDVAATIKEMMQEAQSVLASGWPLAKGPVRHAIEGERAFLIELARARLEGEIDDDVLTEQLRDERRALADSLLIYDAVDARTAPVVAAKVIAAFARAVA